MRTRTTRESLAQGIVRQLMPRGRFLLFDFGSSFGTILQDVHGFLPPLEGLDVAVLKVHILHSRLKTKRADSSRSDVSISFTIASC